MYSKVYTCEEDMVKRVRKFKRYKSPEILKEMINSYFDECDALETPYTISGLCLVIGYSKDQLMSENSETPLGELIVQARLLIEQQHEYQLYSGVKPQGVIFALKQLGWADKQQFDLGSGNAEEARYTIEIVSPDGKKKVLENGASVQDPGKVVPFNSKTKAV